MLFISPKSTIEEIDKKLQERYTFGFWEFSYSLIIVTLFYLTYKTKRGKKSLIEEKIRRLNIEKSRVIENIKQFLIETDIWEVLKQKRTDIQIFATKEKENEFIINKFNLKFLFEILEKRIERFETDFKLLDKVHYKIPVKKLNINPCTLTTLIWSLAMKVKEKSNYDDFQFIGELIQWFSINKKWNQFFGRIPQLTKDTIRINYSRYMKNSSRYKEIATMFYIYCFLDFADELKSIFPDPFIFAIWEYENIHPLDPKT